MDDPNANAPPMRRLTPKEAAAVREQVPQVKAGGGKEESPLLQLLFGSRYTPVTRAIREQRRLPLLPLGALLKTLRDGIVSATPLDEQKVWDRTDSFPPEWLLPELNRPSFGNESEEYYRLPADSIKPRIDAVAAAAHEICNKIGNARWYRSNMKAEMLDPTHWESDPPSVNAGSFIQVPEPPEFPHVELLRPHIITQQDIETESQNQLLKMSILQGNLKGSRPNRFQMKKFELNIETRPADDEPLKIVRIHIQWEDTTIELAFHEEKEQRGEVRAALDERYKLHQERREKEARGEPWDTEEYRQRRRDAYAYDISLEHLYDGNPTGHIIVAMKMSRRATAPLWAAPQPMNIADKLAAADKLIAAVGGATTGLRFLAPHMAWKFNTLPYDIRNNPEKNHPAAIARTAAEYYHNTLTARETFLHEDYSKWSVSIDGYSI